jgi:hypothetical protein
VRGGLSAPQVSAGTDACGESAPHPPVRCAHGPLPLPMGEGIRQPLRFRLWIRISAQIYNHIGDYRRLADALTA